MKSNEHSSAHYEISDRGDRVIAVRFRGNIDVDTASAIHKSLFPLLSDRNPSKLVIDLEAVTAFDDYGALILAELKHLVPEGKDAFEVINAKNQSKEVLYQVDFETLEKCAVSIKSKRSVHLLVNLGETTLSQLSTIRLMVAFLGSVFLAFTKVIMNPKSLRMDDTIGYMEDTGVHALPIVAMISFLLGLIIAFMSSMQLKQFGANIYVASLVALAMVSELGPIMTAIIVAGRTGSAYAAEIGTMKISEEVDALFSMGFDPTLFLVVPRMIASIMVVPILTLFSDIFAITGGLVIGVMMLKLSPGAYITQTIDTLTLTEIIWSFAKSIVFATLISWVACLRGFQAQGGAASVGNAATSAVVSSIFLIILFDSIFAVIRSYWG